MDTEITAIAKGMLAQMAQRGASEATVRNYRESLCQPVIRYCCEHGNGCYSAERLECYLKKQEERYERGEIKNMVFVHGSDEQTAAFIRGKWNCGLFCGKAS